AFPRHTIPAMPPADRRSPIQQQALCAIARAIAESLELSQVWDRVAEACRTMVPFDGMAVSRFEKDHVHTVVVSGTEARHRESVIPFADFSPLLRPPARTRILVVRDTHAELDRAFALDAQAIDAGYRSLLRLSLGPGPDTLGHLVLVSNRVGTY